MKFLFSICLLVLGFAFAQTPTSGTGDATSKSDFASQSIFDRLSHEISKRAGLNDDKSAIGRKPLNIVFLLDSSQNSAKDFLPLFEQKVITGILRRLGAAQFDAKVSDDALDDISLYPYQLKLIDDPKWTVKGLRLKKGQGTVQNVIEHVPPRRVPIPGEEELGHDSSGARKALIEQVGLADAARSTIIIQMSPTGVNSDPSNPANNEKITKEDARSGLLTGTDYVVYDDDGRYYQTDPPGAGLSPSDVHVWLYGPAKFTVEAATPTDKPPVIDIPPAAPAQPASNPPYVLFILAAVVMLSLVYVAYRFFTTFPVELDGEIGKAGFNHPLSIVTAGGKPGERILQISPQRLGTVSGGLKVGEISVPLLFGGPKVSGGGGHTLFINNSSKADHILTTKPTMVEFGKGDTRTGQIPVKLR